MDLNSTTKAGVVGTPAQQINYTAAVFLLTLLVFGVGVLYQQALPKPLPGIPYNKASASKFFGDALDFVQYTKETGEAFEWMTSQCTKLNSPIIQVFLGPFKRPAVVLTDFREIQDVDMRRTREFDRGGFLIDWMSLILPQGTISMTSNHQFKTLRQIWGATMTSQFLHSISSRVIEHHTRRLVELWKTKADCGLGRPFNVKDDIREATFDMIWTAAAGEDIALLKNRTDTALKTVVSSTASQDEAVEFPPPKEYPPIVPVTEELVSKFETMRASPVPSLTKAWIKKTPRFQKIWKAKDDMIKKLLEDSREKFSVGGPDQPVTCAMDEVLKREYAKESKGEKVTEREMIDEIFSYIVGGHETTQDTTSWSLKYLTANPEKQTKLRTALLEVFPGCNANNLPSAQTIVSTDIPYLDACINEFLRTARTAAFSSRVATQDTTLLGYRVPAGTDVFGVLNGDAITMQHDLAVDEDKRSQSSQAAGVKYKRWALEDKQAFKPERWLNAEGEFDQFAGPSMPFGAGARGCFGQKLARMELRMMILILVLSFEFRDVPTELASFRPKEMLTRGPAMCYIRPQIRT